MQERILFRFKPQYMQLVKPLLHALRAEWDELFTAWMVKPDKAQELKTFLSQNKVKYFTKSVSFSDEYLTKNKGKEIMHGKYATILTRVINLENRLLCDCERYEKFRSANNGLRRSYHFYYDPPTRENCRNESEFLIEKNLYMRWHEIRKLRSELQEINESLQEVGSASKG